MIIDDDRITDNTLIIADSIEDGAKSLLQSIGRDHSSRMRVWVKKNIDLMIPYTGKQYGWDDVDGKLVPNWEEQRVICMMKGLREQGHSYAKIARTLDDLGFTGAQGGKWQGHAVKRTINRLIHDNIDDFEKPNWWTV